MEKKFNAGKAWAVVIVAILCQVTFAMGLMKVPSNMVLIMTKFGVDTVGASWLMNALGITSLILALPAGMIMQKLGARKVMLSALCIYFIGSLVGVIGQGSGSFAMMIVSRAIEGFGYGMQMVAAPQFVSEWFPAEKRGLPQGLSSIWFSIGSLIIMNTAAHLPGVSEGSFVWSWYVCMAATAIMFVVALFVAKSPSAEYMQLEVSEDENADKPSAVEGLKSASTWFILISFFTFGFINSAFSSYYPTYLQQDFAMDMATANLVTSYATIAMIVAGFLGGILLNSIKVTKRPIYNIILVILVGAIGLVMFNLPSAGYATPMCIVLGFVFQLYPGCAYAIAPEMARSGETVSVTMGLMAIGNSIMGVFGNLIASIFMAAAGGSWAAVTIPNGIFLVIGLIGAIGVLITSKKKYIQYGYLDENGNEIEKAA